MICWSSKEGCATGHAHCDLNQGWNSGERDPVRGVKLRKGKEVQEEGAQEVEYHGVQEVKEIHVGKCTPATRRDYICTCG